MNLVAIEFDNTINNTHKKGFLRIPYDFNSTWNIWFLNYLKDKYGAEEISIYPLNIQSSFENHSAAILNYDNMEDDFILALRSNIYYPDNDDNNYIRRQWASLDLTTSSFTVKER